MDIDLQAVAKKGNAGRHRWHVPLVRSIRDGRMDEMERYMTENPAVMHHHFTEEMTDWELQWESTSWYELKKVTPLYLAAAYGKPEVVRWLIDRGADASVECYHKMSPLDMAGAYYKDGDEEMRHKDVTECRQLLKGPKRVPIAPNEPNTNTKISTLQEVLVELPADSEEGEFMNVAVSANATMRKKVVKKIDAKCELAIGWHTPWLPGGTRYELRYKKHAYNDADASKDTGDKDKDKKEKGEGSWKTEKTRGTRYTMRMLPTATDYTFQVRAQNDVGWGPFTEAVTVSTPAHPQPEKAVPGQR